MTRRRPHTGHPLLPATLASVCIASIALAAPSTASADGLTFNLPWLGPSSYSFTNTTIALYRHQNFNTNFYDDRIFGFTERYDSALTSGPFRLQLRLDAFAPLLTTPVDQAMCMIPGCDYLRADVRLERIQLRYQRGPITIEAGDVYTVIGRGIALAFRKVDQLGLDTAIRGGRVEVDTRYINIRGFGGIANPQNLDPITQQVNHDAGDAIAGGPCWTCGTIPPGTSPTQRAGGSDVLGGLEVAARLGPEQEVEFGVHGLHVHFPGQGLGYSDVDVIGYRAAAPSLLDGRLALYVEVNALRRIETRLRPMGGVLRTDQNFGHAIYGSAQATLGNLNVLGEWKDYRNYLVSPDGTVADLRRIYSAAPSLERYDVQWRTNANTRGGRLQLEYAFRPSTWSAALNLVANGFDENVTVDPWSREALGAAHGYLTVRRRGTRRGPPVVTGPGVAPNGLQPWQLSATIGFRREFLLGPHPDRQANSSLPNVGEPGAPDREVLHADIDFSFPLTPKDSLEITLDGRLETRWGDFAAAATDPMRPGAYYSYVRAGAATTWSHSDWLTASLLLRYDGSNLPFDQRYPDRDAQTGMVTLTPYPTVFPAAELRYRFLSGSFVRLFGGMTPGGLLCSGGVCRQVPPFQGAIIELVLRI